MGLHSLVLVASAAIVFGGALVFGSGVLAGLNALEVTRSGGQDMLHTTAREAGSAAAGVQVFVGLGSITLGILALLSLAPLALTLVAMLAVGAAMLLSGTAINKAINDETSVPKMNGRAPNCSLTGFQSLLKRNRQPNFRSAR